MSGGGSIKSNNIAKYSVYLFASLNIIIRMYAILCVPLISQSEPITVLIWFTAAAIPFVSWGLYFAIFGLRASYDWSVWEQGKGRFTLIYTRLMWFLVIINITILFPVLQCNKGLECLNIYVSMLLLWLETFLQFGTGMSIKRLYKDKTN